MTVAFRLVRDRRRSTLWWVAGVVGMVLFVLAFYPSLKGQASLDELVDDLPEAMRSLFGIEEGVSLSSAAGYLQARLYATTLPVMLIVFAIGLGARTIGGSEEEGTLELLLANPVTRRRVAVERYAAAVGLLVALGVASTVAALMLAPVVGALDDVAVTGVLGANAGAVCLALLHLSIAFAVGAARGRRGPALAAAAGVAVGGYLLQGLASATDVLHPARFFTPWQWYLGRNMLVNGVAPDAIVVPVVLSAIAFAAGLVLFARRDLR
jgi:ABC-2 type transport system permease protein